MNLDRLQNGQRITVQDAALRLGEWLSRWTRPRGTRVHLSTLRAHPRVDQIRISIAGSGAFSGSEYDPDLQALVSVAKPKRATRILWVTGGCCLGLVLMGTENLRKSGGGLAWHEDKKWFIHPSTEPSWRTSGLLVERPATCHSFKRPEDDPPIDPPAGAGVYHPHGRMPGGMPCWRYSLRRSCECFQKHISRRFPSAAGNAPK